MLRVGIIGCGLIGKKRATAISGARVIACADIVPARAEALAASLSGVEPIADWRTLLDCPDVEAVIVATTHDALAEITLEAVSRGKHVLVEKPAARSSAELDPAIAEQRRRDVAVRVGFNHRYHSALLRAKELVEAGAIGQLLYVRGRYGHGGRPGYEKEWRANPALSGGGELIDQGVHLIDLSRWFLGEFATVAGAVHTYYWNMTVEDNGFLLLTSAQGQVAFLHASCTEWKNLFSFEIFGKEGKLAVDGLGGSYGVERLAYYRMLPEMGPPETTMWEYPGTDRSWEREWQEFLLDISLGRPSHPGLADARAALEIVGQVYKGAQDRENGEVLANVRHLAERRA
jgi:predicted dehydrogenase